MTTHYIKIALRNMRRFRLQTIVCLTGLAVGMTCFALGTLWLRFIESFEDFVPNVERVYIALRIDPIHGFGYSLATPSNLGEKLQAGYPEVEDFCCVFHSDEHRVATDDKVSLKLQVAGADERFMSMFGIKALQGDVSHLQKNEIALTRSAAARLFGSKPALGQIVTVEASDLEKSCSDKKETQCIVTAIIPDCPFNTQTYYEAIAGLDVDMWREDARNPHFYHTFVKLHKNVDKSKLYDAQGRIAMSVEQTYGDDSHSSIYEYEFNLMPIRNLRTDDNAYLNKVSTTYVRWFMFIGLIVILCSLTNYLLTMASHLRRRGWEMSLRRVLGASVRSILVMFGFETVILFVLSAVLALLLTLLVLPSFREYSEITMPLSAIAQRLAVYLIVVIVAGLAVSSFTAWIIMKRTQRNVLSSRQMSHSSHSLDRFSVILQMSLAMGIIFILIVMLRQINFLMYSNEKGFDHCNMGMVTQGVTEELRHKILQSPLLDGQPIEKVNTIYPRRSSMRPPFSAERNGEHNLKIDFFLIDTLIFDFYRMTQVEGRLPIAKYYGTNVVREDTIGWSYGAPVVDNVYPPKEICVNEALCQMMKWNPEFAIGQSLYSGEQEYRICGVLLNAGIDGPTIPVAPAMYMNVGDYAMCDVELFNPNNLQFRAKPGRLTELIDSIDAWADSDDVYISNNEAAYNMQLESELMLIRILMAVGGASLFVCVIGTFSLVSLSLAQRRKEIAVRKVHGATMKDILRLFLKGQIVSLVLAAAIAYPVAYIVMRYWLEGYAKQVGIDWWLIPTTFLAIAAVVLATITLKIWKAARESTVEALNS